MKSITPTTANWRHQSLGMSEQLAKKNEQIWDE
jgi:hypothetical protein